MIVEEARGVEALPDHVEEDVRNFLPHSITKTNELFCVRAVVVTNRLGVEIDKVAGRKEPLGKGRLQNKIKELRKDLSQLQESKDKYSNFRHWQKIVRKCSIRVKSLNVVIEELKQKITAIAARVRRYQGGV